MNNGYGSGDTIQNALKRLFCSIGGNADNVRNKDDINAILDEMTALNIGKEIYGGGGGGGVLVANIVLDSPTSTPTLDKTWQEIHDADLSVVVFKGTNAKAKTALVTEVITSTSSSLLAASPSPLVHTVRTISTNGDSALIERWTTMSPDGYPELAK